MSFWTSSLVLSLPFRTSTVWLFMVRVLQGGVTYIRHKDCSIKWIPVCFRPIKSWGRRWGRNLWNSPRCLRHLTQAVITIWFFLIDFQNRGAVRASNLPTTSLLEVIEQKKWTLANVLPVIFRSVQSIKLRISTHHLNFCTHKFYPNILSSK